MLRDLPMGVKIRIWMCCCQLLAGDLDRDEDVPRSWRYLVLAGIPRKDTNGGWESFRWIAKTAVMAKNYHRFIVGSAMLESRAYPLHSYGFSKGFRCSDVSAAVGCAVTQARKFGYPLVVLEADIKWCFDEIDHVRMVECLRARGWPPATVRAIIEEYSEV